MTNTLKRLLSMLMVVLMVVSMVPTTVFAAEETETTVSSFEELQAAIDAAANGGTVVLLDNLTVESDLNNAGKGLYNIAEGQKVTIDLNGKTIDVTDNSTGNFILFYNYGELTIENGTINLTATNDRDWNAESAIVLNRGGILNVESGTYTHKGGTDMAFVLDNSGNWYGDATTNVKGGTLTSTYIAIRNRMEQNSHGASGEAILNVTAGTIKGTSRAIWAQAASVSETAPATGAINVSGGEIGLIDTPRSTGAVSMTTISGGNVEAFKGEVGELTVTGGTLGKVTMLTAAGEDAEHVKTDSGLYVQAVAKIIRGKVENTGSSEVGFSTLQQAAKYQEIYFETLEEALAAIQAGDELVLLADVTMSEILVIDKSITLDGNGHKLTSTAGRAINVSGADGVTIKNLTIDCSGERAINVIQNATNVTIDNVTATASNYTVNVAASTKNAVVTIKDSTLTGLNVVNVASAGADVTVEGSTINCNDKNTTAGECYAALCLNKDAVGGKITATGCTINVPADSDSVKARNGAENGKITIDGSADDVKTTVAIITYPNSDSYYGFETLEDAIAFASAGDTVTLMQDIALAEGIVVNGDVVIDLNGKTISGTDTTNKSFSLITNKGDLTIKDSVGTGKITLTATQDTGYNRYSSVISNTVGGKLTVESGIIEHLGGHTMAYAIDNLTNGKGAYAETVINGGTVKSSYVGIRQFLNGVEADNILTVNGGTVTGNNTSIFFQDPSDKCNSGKLVVGENATLGNRIYVSGTAGTPWDVELSVSAQALGTYGITTDEIPATCMIKEVNGVYGIVNAVASVNGIGYETLAEAIDAAQDGDTVVLLDNIALDTSIKNTKKITLDLNGKTITGTDKNTSGNFYLINNVGELTVTGNGTITLVAENNRAWNASSVVIANNPGGKLIVENGTIEHLGGSDMAYGIDNLTNGKGTYAETIINGGNIKSTYRAVRQFLNGIEAQNILTINGGVIEGTNKSVWMQDPSKNANSGELTISENATLKGDVYLYVTAGSTEWPVAVSIATAALADGSTVLTGNVPNGYIVEQSNGTWGVREANYVAEVGGTEYESLQDAVNAAQAGETITVLDNIVLTESLVIAADDEIILDLNGKTISQTKACTESYEMINNKGNLIITGDGKISFTDTSAGDPSFGWGSYTLRNEGTVVVENGTIEHLGQQNQGSVKHMYCAIFQYSGSTTINGGTISTPTYRSVRLWKGDMTINGGKFEGQVWVQAVDNSAELTITDGSFAPRGVDGSSVFVGNITSTGVLMDVELNVIDGNFATKIGANNAEAVKGDKIVGGTFTEAAKNGTKEALLGAGFVFTENDDGTYGVTEKVELPKVEITDIKNSLKDSDPDLTFALNFAIKDDGTLTDEYLQKVFEQYGNHYVDYVLTINGLTEQSVTFNGDGTADGYLAGQYDAWSENWVVVPPKSVTISNGESLYIMETAASLLGEQGLRFTLAEVAEIVQNFDCGIYFTPEFLGANPNMEVTLELKVFTEDAEGNKIDDISVAKDTFTVPAPERPTATVSKLNNEDLSFAMNFIADEVTAEQLAYYKNWYADFELKVNKDVTFNANGGADGYLSGQYDEWSENWINVPFEDVTLKANETLKIMAYAAEMLGEPGLKLTYNDVYTMVKDFDCGVFFTDAFLAANPDLEVTLELRMYNPTDETESYTIGETYVFTNKETYVAKNIKTNKEYTTLAEALSAAKSGETVQLLTNIKVEDDVMVRRGTLDLNGYTLVIAEDYFLMASFNDTFVIDSSAENTGLIVADASQLILLDNNTQLPLETAEGIRFADITLGDGWKPAMGAYEFWIDSADAMLIEELSNDDCNVVFEVELNWNGGNQVFRYTYQNVYDYLTVGNGWTWNSLYLLIRNAESVEGLTYTARVVFAPETSAEVVVTVDQAFPHSVICLRKE